MKFVFFAASVVLAVPGVFAQASTVAPTILIAPGVTYSPSNSPVSERPFPDAVIAQEPVAVPVVAVGSNTGVMGASALPVSRYWFNVPKDIDEREDFRRWRGLR